MDIRGEMQGDVHVLRLVGEFDETADEALRDCVEATIAHNQVRVVIDMEQARLGLKVLLSLVRAQSRFRESGGELAVGNVPRDVCDTIARSELACRLACFDSIEKACERVRRGGDDDDGLASGGVVALLPPHRPLDSWGVARAIPRSDREDLGF